MKMVLGPMRAEGLVNVALIERLRAAAPDVQIVHAPDAESCRQEIVDADAFYGNIAPEVLAAATKLTWIQSPNIGQEHHMFPALQEHPSTLTNIRGIFSDDIADHVMGCVLIFARGFHRYQRHQQQHTWAKGPDGGYPTDVVHLPDATMGIFGLGGIGRAVATRAVAFEMKVLAVDPRPEGTPPGVSEVWPPERLAEMLALSDFVAICAPETPETRGLFTAQLLGAMRPTAYLINIARGTLIDEPALIAALRDGTIAGAGLDVFAEEPLPASSPLWDMENVIVTPHISGAGPHYLSRLHAIVVENLRRFVAGEPLMNVVDKERWY